MCSDPVLAGFLRDQLEEGLALVRASDLVELAPLNMDVGPPDRYLVRMRCKGFVRGGDGVVREADDFLAGIWFPADYLRQVEPLQVVTWLEPAEVFHPNLRTPLVCLGPIAPGTPLVQLIYRLFDVVSYQMWAAHDALNGDAAQWARNHLELLPADRRPLKRRLLRLEQEPETVGDLS